MLVNIAKIEGNKLTVVKDEKVKTYEMQDNVVPYAELGVADITFNNKTEKIELVKMQTAEEVKEGFKPRSYNQAAKNPKAKAGKTQITVFDKKYDVEVAEIKGKKHILYGSLIGVANQAGLISFEILEQFISEDMKRAWVKVRAHVSVKGKPEMKYFDGLGSSTPDNTGDMTSSYPIEMAHTRAKGRALRDFLSIGEALSEEMKQ